MKKFLISILALCLAAAFVTGCAKNPSDKKDGDGEIKTEEPAVPDEKSVEKKFNLDMKSSETQPMSSDRASKEVLSETVTGFLGGNTLFTGTELEKLTYADFVEHIGCDASEYKYDDDEKAECYTWIAKDDDQSKLSIWISGGKLLYSGSANLL